MLDNETKKAIRYIAQQKRYEELLREKEKLEAEIMKEKTGVSPEELLKLKDYFTRGKKK